MGDILASITSWIGVSGNKDTGAEKKERNLVACVLQQISFVAKIYPSAIMFFFLEVPLRNVTVFVADVVGSANQAINSVVVFCLVKSCFV